MQPDEVR
jgi:methylglutaconyl-CoA hydratase